MKENKTRSRKSQLTPTLDLPTASELSFEQSLAELERMVGELERDDLTLEDALHYFENGIHLIQRCDSHLKSAQGKVKELFKGENREFMERVLGLTLESFLTGETQDD
ncbi:MAG TPA: exodeoxyribonuclease VII small subunit [Chitinispirillaceae bacterium]|nr:exodeoxyribonuclease VII small subunit [Chitinispirillaceae bacterium]